MVYGSVHATVDFKSKNGVGSRQEGYSDNMNLSGNGFNNALKRAIWNASYSHVKGRGGSYEWTYRIVDVEVVSIKRSKNKRRFTIEKRDLTREESSELRNDIKKDKRDKGDTDKKRKEGDIVIKEKLSKKNYRKYNTKGEQKYYNRKRLIRKERAERKEIIQLRAENNKLKRQLTKRKTLKK